MRIAISGTSGFVGGRLKTFCQESGHDVIKINRQDLLQHSSILRQKVTDADVVIHLSGASLMRRFTRKNKSLIRQSRIETTRNLSTAIQMVDRPPALFISTSAVGIYHSKGVHSEDEFVYDMGFLAKVCKDWEAEAMKAVTRCRVAIFRFGVILDKKEGAFPKMLKLFKSGFGGKIASGKQAVPWVHIEDVLRAYEYAIKNPRVHGPFNIVSPGVLQSAEYTRMLAKKLHRPHLVPAPGWALRLALGKSSELITHGQSVVPKRLLDCGFSFKYPILKDALEELV